MEPGSSYTDAEMLYLTLVLVFLELLGPLQEATVDYRAPTGHGFSKG